MNTICSIVIPAYNAEKTLSRTLSSIKIEGEVEVIVVDDGSIDRTVEVAKSFPFVKVISKKNGGVSSARNVGIEESVGDYLFFFDADDILNSKVFNDSIRAIKRHYCDFFVCDYKTFDFVSQKESEIKCGIPYNTILGREYITGNLLKRCFLNDCVGIACLMNKFFKRNIVLENKIFFDERRTHAEDFDFVVRFLDCCSNMIASSEYVFTYSLDGSQTPSKYKDKNLGAIDLHNFLDELRKKYNYCDENSIEYFKFQSGFLNVILAYILQRKDSKKEIKTFLSNNTVKTALTCISKLNRNQLESISRCRREKLAAYLIKKGWYNVGIRVGGFS